jgi:hypothetical protein
MATAILRGAKTYHVAGLVFRLGEPQAVDDQKLAQTLADLPDYFDVRFEDTKAPAKTVGVKSRARDAAVDPAPEGVEI